MTRPTSKSLKSLLLAGLGSLLLAACSGEETNAPVQPDNATRQGEVTVETVTQSEAFLALLADHASELLRNSPEMATSLGVSSDIAGEGFNARLGDYSFATVDRQISQNERFLRELRAFDRDQLEGTAAVSYDVMRHAYRTAAARNQFGFGPASVTGSSPAYIITQLSGPHLSLPRLLLTAQPLHTEADAEDWLARLAEMDRVLLEVRDRVEMDAGSGIIPPDFALRGAAGSIRSLTAPPLEEHPLIIHFVDRLNQMDLTAERQTALVNTARNLLAEEVYPAYGELASTLEDLAQRAGSDAGIWRLDDGAAFYQHTLDSYGAGGMTAEEVHQIGLDEVARISAEMDAILADMGKTEGGIGARFASLADDPDMVYPNTDEGKAALLAELVSQVEAINLLAPDWFGTLPPQEVEVRRIPEYEQDSAPGGYYTGPSLDGERPGIYWINLKDTADWPKYTLKTLTYHEAVPGHHFQIALQQDVEDMPLIRNMMFYSEYGEGWALYAEKLAAEMGMYENDPLGDLGRLQSELFRAARLVVDTGLHHKRWTREEAIDYMVEVTGDTRAALTREVERYAVWPGQATSYKLGMIKMEELRARAEAALGDDFDIKAFHDEILLSGSVPLPVLEAKIDRWIENHRAG